MEVKENYFNLIPELILLWYSLKCISSKKFDELVEIYTEMVGIEKSRGQRRIATHGKSNHGVSGPGTNSPLWIAISAE